MTTIRPADARHMIANLKAAEDRALAMFHRGEISQAQLDGLMDHIGDEIRAIRGREAA